MKAFKLTLKIIRYIVSVLLIAVLIVGVIYAFKKIVLKQDMPSVLGYSVSVVISGSMEPELSIDDMIIIKRADQYTKGDVITFRAGNDFVTHRIIEVTANGFITQGDANNTVDNEVAKGNVVGKLSGVIPKAGTVLQWFRTPIGITAAVVVIILIAVVPELFKRLSKKTN